MRLDVGAMITARINRRYDVRTIEWRAVSSCSSAKLNNELCAPQPGVAPKPVEKDSGVPLTATKTKRRLMRSEDRNQGATQTQCRESNDQTKFPGAQVQQCPYPAQTCGSGRPRRQQSRATAYSKNEYEEKKGFSTYTAQEMILQVELASRGAMSLNCLENLSSRDM